MPNANAQTTNSHLLKLQNQVSYTYNAVSQSNCDLRDPNGCGRQETFSINSFSSPVIFDFQELVDPLGQITGCAGEILPDYQGFSVGLYETDPNDVTGSNLRRLVALTQTELPDNSSNSIPTGLKPNIGNSNPFFLTNSDHGTYNFLLDVQRGQLDTGRTYILVVNPPKGSIYGQRRIRLTIGTRIGNQVSYTAASLDGKPISASNNQTVLTGSLTIADAAQTGLVLAILDLRSSVCQAQEIQIIKSGDRVTAEPGDTIIYRLSVRNLSNTPINNLVITDLLPVGFRLREGSVKAEFQKTLIPVTTTQNGSTLTFNFDNFSLPIANANQNNVLNLAYASVLTPDAIRGSGQNRAIVRAQRIDNLQPIKDGPAIHRLRIRSGILTNCGTIIGRVFIDKNFDGEQQPGEPGVPNAVIFLDDGNRITTDPNGLFSVANVLSGHRSGVLDLSSLPGYTLAPNRYFHERNSQSRLVHLAPGGLVRMNFAVTPVSGEAKQR